MVAIQGLIGRAKQSIGLRGVPELDKRLAGMERIFRAPPLTKELVAAIKLIAPHFDFTTREKYRAIWKQTKMGVVGVSIRRSPLSFVPCQCQPEF